MTHHDHNQHPSDSTNQLRHQDGGQHTNECTDTGWLPRWPEYLPDRYDRLAGAINEIATTPAFFQPGSITPGMLRELGTRITAGRLLDGLTDRDADCVAIFVVMTFPNGIPHMILRLDDQIQRAGSGYQPADDHSALLAVLTGVLATAYEITQRP